MKITVDLPEKDLRDICRITGISKKGPAIRKLLDDALLLQRRAEFAGKFVSGEWGAELAGVEESKAAGKAKTQTFAGQWRD
ncbi:MAG TPA: hypothetical protein VLO11_05510 [Luteolibacter sp.]|nr:hypothetical protein [Luteolibacter sp.]